MAVNSYTRGAAIHLTGAFTKKSDGSAIDPSAVNLVVVDAAGGSQTFTYPSNIQRDGTGLYHYDYPTTHAVSPIGNYTYAWWSTGTGQAAAEGMFNVAPTRAS